MPDISMCKGGECPLKEKCHRFLVKPNELRQAYFITPPFVNNECEHFQKASDQTIVDYWRRWIPEADKETAEYHIETYLRIYGGELVPGLLTFLQRYAQFPVAYDFSEEDAERIREPTSVSVMSAFMDDGLDCLNVLVNEVPVCLMWLSRLQAAAFLFPECDRAKAIIKETIAHCLRK